MSETYKGLVNRTVDGDTFHIQLEKRVVEKFFDVETIVIQRSERIIRVRGVDTPERGDIGYKEATAFTREALTGKEVTIEVVGVDKYKRDLAHVTLPTGEDLGELLIEKKLARKWID